MTVFISHSFGNRPEFENVAEWLAQVGVPHFEPDEVKSAESLREQLRRAISDCSTCIFVATHESVRSSWCGAELGAFWGRGVPVIVYLADSSLTEDQLPPVVQGDVWERKLSRVAERAKELSAAGGSGTPASVPPTARVAAMTAEQLENLITSAVLLGRAEANGTHGQAAPDPAGSGTAVTVGRVLRAADTAGTLARSTEEHWRKSILWVDDRPANNIYERSTLEALGCGFTLATTTDEGLAELRRNQFGAIISDMGRREGPDEGYVLLEKVRSLGITTPFFIYAGSRAAAHRIEAEQRGAQGTTNSPSELVDMVTQALHGPEGPA